jgi:hypothetical protein
VYVQDLEWFVETYTDIYMMIPIDPDLKKIKAVKLIGTPRGNKLFYSELYGIPLENFYDGAIDDLLKMSAKGRIEAFLHERASTLTMIKQLKIENIHYRLYDRNLRASLAVRNDAKGNELK